MSLPSLGGLPAGDRGSSSTSEAWGPTPKGFNGATAQGPRWSPSWPYGRAASKGGGGESYLQQWAPHWRHSYTNHTKLGPDKSFANLAFFCYINLNTNPQFFVLDFDLISDHDPSVNQKTSLGWQETGVGCYSSAGPDLVALLSCKPPGRMPQPFNVNTVPSFCKDSFLPRDSSFYCVPLFSFHFLFTSSLN